MNVAIVTGGARGIGLGCVQALIASGIQVVAIAHHSDDLGQLQALGSAVKVVVGDVVTETTRTQALTEAAKLGTLVALINNAGIAPDPRRDVLETDMDSYERVLAVNLRAPLEMAIAVAKAMLVQPAGESEATPRVIINITSANARMVSTDRVEYSASKAGLSAVTRVLAARLAPEGINVYEIVPGIVETSMTSVVKSKYDRLIHETPAVPSRRWGKPADVGQVVSALARGEFGYSPGQVFYVDGGLSLPQL